MGQYMLGRHASPKDIRDYRLDGLVAPSTKSMQFWATGPCLDQDQTSQCTAFSAKQWLWTMPIHDPSDDITPEIIYADSQKIDGIDLPHDGSTVKAVAQVLSGMGYIKDYSFATDINTVTNYVLDIGPMMIGIPFYNSMFTPVNGYFNVDPSSGLAGGHAVMVMGVNLSLPIPALRIQNSWGKNWCYEGRCWLAIKDFAGMLFSGDAEACTATKLFKAN